MRVSLNVFADFVVGNPSTRAKAVRTTKQDFNPGQDYWLPMRRAILDGQAKGLLGEKLQRAVDKAHPSRAANYQAMADSYGEWSASQTLEWVGTQQAGAGGRGKWRSRSSRTYT